MVVLMDKLFFIFHIQHIHVKVWVEMLGLVHFVIFVIVIIFLGLFVVFIVVHILVLIGEFL